MILIAKLAVAYLLAGSPKPDRSKVMTQTKRDTPLPAGWGLVVEFNPTPEKNLRSGKLRDSVDVLTNRRRPVCKEKDLIFGTRNIRTLFKTGALLCLHPQLKEYRLAILAVQETRWQGKDMIDMK